MPRTLDKVQPGQTTHRHSLRKYFTWRCICLHSLATLGLLFCAIAGRTQYRSSSNKPMSLAHIVEWLVFSVYLVHLWWKLIHQKHVPIDKDWAIKARAAAEFAGIPLNEIPGWATDKQLRRAVIAQSRGHTATPALPSSRPTHIFGSLEAQVVPTQPPISSPSARSKSDEFIGENVRVVVPDDPEEEVIIDVKATSSKVLIDDKLVAYNQYLSDLSRRDPPKLWRRQRGSPSA
jgi:hypothetical protein